MDREGDVLVHARVVPLQHGQIVAVVAALELTGADLTRPLRAVRRRRPALPAGAARFWSFLSRLGT
jgi:hypothetical protein